jgi:hypothetical protein
MASNRKDIHPSPNADSLDTPIWGAAAIGRVINRSQRAVFHLLESGLLPAEKVGAIWVSTPRKLRKAIGIEAA